MFTFYHDRRAIITMMILRLTRGVISIFFFVVYNMTAIRLGILSFYYSTFHKYELYFLFLFNFGNAMSNVLICSLLFFLNDRVKKSQADRTRHIRPLPYVLRDNYNYTYPWMYIFFFMVNGFYFLCKLWFYFV